VNIPRQITEYQLCHTI